MEGFVDPDKYKELQKRIADAYLDLGLTIVQQGSQIDDDGDLYVITVALVRETALEQITQDTTIREQFAAQMTADADARIQARLEEIAKAIEEGRTLEVLTGEQPLSECSHERIYEGLCLDCQTEVTT